MRYGAISYNNYILRRILRIWPLYLFAIGVAAIIAVFNGEDIAKLIISLISLFSFSVNLELAKGGFGPPGYLVPLWSVSIEEHFYLFAPLLYMLTRSRHLLTFAIVIWIFSNIFRGIYLVAFPAWPGGAGIFYQSFAYTDVFLAGALASKLYISLPQNVAGNRDVKAAFSRFAGSPLACVGALVFLVAICRIWGLSLFPPSYRWYSFVPYSLLPFAIFFLLFSCIYDRNSLISKFLAIRAFRILGVLSYSMYVTHLFVYGLFDYLIQRTYPGLPTLARNVCAIALVIAVSACTHFAVERPFLRLKRKISGKSPDRVGSEQIPWAAIVSVALVTSGIAVYLGSSFEGARAVMPHLLRLLLPGAGS